MTKHKRLDIILIAIFCLLVGFIIVLYLTKDNNENVEITIGKNGNWYINNVDTNVSAYHIGNNTTKILTGNETPNRGNKNDIFVDLDSFDYYLYIDDYWQLRGNIKEKPKDVSYEGDLELHLLEDGTYAIYSCTNDAVEEIIIPSYHNKRPITKLLKQSLFNCQSLKYIEIPNTINEIGYRALNSSELLFNEYNGSYYIGNQDNPYLVLVSSETPTIHILDETKLIYNLCDFIFYDTELILSDNNKWFKLFDGNLYNKDMTKLICYRNDSGLPDSVRSLGSWSFCFCSNLTSIVIPDNITSIVDYAFEGCCYLSKITIPNSVTSIGDGAFCRCSALTNIEIPNSVTSIGDYAFEGCVDLSKITIPNSVTSIGEGAFSLCHSLTSIEISDSVTSIGDGAFQWCSKLQQINVGSSNLNYVSIDGNLYTKDRKTLVRYAIGKQEDKFNIPAGIKIIGDSAFEGCSNLTRITIPDSVTNIGSFAFFGCSSLKSIVIPDSVKYIGFDAFDECSSLIIYCESRPRHSGSDSNWKPYFPIGRVYWKDQWEYDIDGNPCPIK